MARIEDMLAGIGDDIDLVDIRLLKAGQPVRLGGLNAAHVRLLAEVEQELPPLVVHRPSMRVVDGAHRLTAMRSRGLEQVPVVYFDGTEDEAFVIAVRLNVVHGKALRTRDRIAAAQRILAAHPEWSDRWIAAVCCIAPRTVAGLRGCSADNDQHLNTRVGRDGRRYPLTTQEGRRTAEQIMRDEPEASLREVARRAGVSAGTALDVRRRLAQNPAETGHSAGARLRAAQRWGTPEDHGRTAPATRGQLEWLTREPSLRYTDRGRALLRLLSMTVAILDDSGPAVTAVPAHCHRSLAAVARSCADSWLSLVEQLVSAIPAPSGERVAAGGPGDDAMRAA
ncbi:MAG TPA: ParB/RepB/Spo0J family partition protein [Candidatus Limnocylindrales bacterium]